MVCDYRVDDCFRDGGVFVHRSVGIQRETWEYEFLPDKATYLDGGVLCAYLGIAVGSLQVFV